MAWIGISFKLGSISSDQSSASQKALQSVSLEEFFWTQRGEKCETRTLIPSVYFVDNSRFYLNGFLGNGTFELPFVNASVANNAISNDPNALVYFFQGNAPYSDFGVFNLFGFQSLSGQGGNWESQGYLILSGSPSTRPILARTLLQQAVDTPLITISGNHRIENIGLENISSDVATGGSMIVAQTSSIGSLILHNVSSSDKVAIDLTEGSQFIRITNSDIYGLVLRTFNNASLSTEAYRNIFRTNGEVAVRFSQSIGASLFYEALDGSTFIINGMTDNTCFNSTISGNVHLGFGFLSSGASIQNIPNGFLRNQSSGALPVANAGAVLFQGVDSSTVRVEGCFNNISNPLTDDFVLQFCEVNIKRAGFTPDAAGLSAANNGMAVGAFNGVSISNEP